MVRCLICECRLPESNQHATLMECIIALKERVRTAEAASFEEEVADYQIRSSLSYQAEIEA